MLMRHQQHLTVQCLLWTVALLLKQTLRAKKPVKLRQNLECNGVLVERNTIFKIHYLGCSKIDDPSSETEMLKLMRFLDEQTTSSSVMVSLAVPHFASGIVVLRDSGGAELTSFPVQRIRFCVRGRLDSVQKCCFSISFTQRGTNGEQSHQCHVFRCGQSETAGRALYCFSQAFSNSGPTNVDGNSRRLEFKLEACLEIRENEGSPTTPHWVLCPQQNNTLKLRRDRQKRLIIQLKQISGLPLTVTKCFGMLLAAGRNLRHSDMHLLELESMGAGAAPSTYVINAIWDPRIHIFDVLNTETPRESRVFLTVAADVIIAEVGEPIRFRIEAKARVFHRDERFYKLPRVSVREGYTLTLERTEDPSSEETPGSLVFVKMESDTDRISAKQRLGRSPSRMPTQLIQPTGDDESDSDEPLLSGSGNVSKDCTEELMEQWKKCIEEWKLSSEGSKPAMVSGLILNGVPDVLRGEVWRLLAKDCPSEQVILKDIHRTFPAHDNFKEAGGEGQESLYKISKAYSLYDEEVSYCQGLSFLAASLLLHMNEEQAFCTLVKIMYDYQLRDLFKLGFDSLHLRFYQLARLLKEYESDLSAHLEHIGVETHMYASQWFLTLFTAKFPLQMVFFIIDLFLSEGMNTIFHISLALLHDAAADLLQLDFEGALKYFRVTLPRKYRTEANAKALIHHAVEFKLKHKRLLKYEKEYIEMKERERENEDPIIKLQRENARYCDTILRLERENDDLAHELVTSKIELRRKLDTVEDQVETSANTIERLARENEDLADENRNLQKEYSQLKEMYRREVSRLEEEVNRTSKLLAEYKHLFSQMSRRCDTEREQFNTQKRAIISRISSCNNCWPAVEEWEANRSPARAAQDGPDLLSQLEEREAHVKALEIDLAQTKLALVEAECKNQDLTHQMMTQSESDSRRWLKKTISSLREVGSSLKQHERSHSVVSVTEQ
ncbi:unnamed protein product [Nippostrongylus brasiliensis]|uniref:Rab GTPase-activating protein 1-like n=1 Tax=Nippostrongylus brasiliensis TaxID=27835 RepID=A0A0N4YG17_NIPBR|nr:unnamed protein product [Nippostrongylus brasiliensis]